MLSLINDLKLVKKIDCSLLKKSIDFWIKWRVLGIVYK